MSVKPERSTVDGGMKQLSQAERRDLVERLLVASTELQSLADDKSFRFHSLTGSVARLVHDWCIIVRDDDEETSAKASQKTTP